MKTFLLSAAIVLSASSTFAAAHEMAGAGHGRSAGAGAARSGSSADREQRPSTIRPAVRPESPAAPKAIRTNVRGGR